MLAQHHTCCVLFLQSHVLICRMKNTYEVEAECRQPRPRSWPGDIFAFADIWRQQLDTAWNYTWNLLLKGMPELQWRNPCLGLK